MEVNYQEAIKWYEKAIEQNESIAKSNLAEMYIFGHGVEVDCQKALELYEEALNDAIEVNDEEEISIVLFNIAEMHEKGYGMEVNYEKAIELYEKSASYGLEESMEKLEELRKILNINE